VPYHEPSARLAVRGCGTGGTAAGKKGVGKVDSVVLADAVKQVECREREMEFVAEGPRELVEEVLDKLLTVLEEG
jgi:hypothetical protein